MSFLKMTKTIGNTLLVGSILFTQGLKAQQRISGGADNVLINEKKIETLLSSDQNVLKNAIANYLKSMDVNQIADLEIKKLFTQKYSREKFIADMRSATYTNSSDCRDELGNKVSASAEIGELGGPICFNVKALAGQFQNMDMESVMIQLASIALHEHLHHLQSPISERDPSEKQKLYNQLENEAYRLSAYVLVTAKNAQLPSLKWSQSTIEDSSAVYTCGRLMKKINMATIEANSSKESKAIYEELAHDAHMTANISRSLFIGSTVLWSGSFYAIGSGAVRGAMALDIFNQAATMAVTKLIFIPVTAALSIYAGGQYLYSQNEDKTNASQRMAEVYLDNAILNFDKTISDLIQKRQNVNLDWSRLANSLTLGGIAERRTKELYELAATEYEVRKNKVIFLKKIYGYQNCQ